MIASPNPILPMRIASNVQLVDMGAVVAMRGHDRDSIRAEIDTGEIPWAWDFASERAPRREIRVWKRCLSDDCVILSKMDFPDVVQEILGSKSEHRSGELQAKLTTTHQSILRWRAAGELHGEIRSHTLWITRNSLVEFLKARRITA